MGPMINPDDDDMKAQLLEQLMGEMDDRVGSQLPSKGPAGVTIDISVTPKGDASMGGGEDDGSDDLADLPPDMAELVRQKRGGY